MALAENMLLQKTMVSGLEIVKTKHLVKLRKGVHATDPVCPGSLISASPLCKIINPKRIGMMDHLPLPHPPPNRIISIFKL
jgi:hypothetical protein